VPDIKRPSIDLAIMLILPEVKQNQNDQEYSSSNFFFNPLILIKDFQRDFAENERINYSLRNILP
jgi:hypothetical protein